MVLKRLPALLAAFLVSTCSAFDPPAVTIDDRLSAFPQTGLPIVAPVRIHWDAYQIPYIVAENDHDLAFALGLVHAHLRGGQLALLRRASQGRLSETAGPFANEIDHALRILDYGYAADAVVAAWPAETRLWMTAFVDGLNHYQQHRRVREPGYGLLNLDDAPWTVQDLVTIGRLAGTDINWLNYFTLLQRRNGPDWQRDWQQALESGGNVIGQQSADAGALDEDTRALAGLLEATGRNGSNSIAIAPRLTSGGSAMIANDPHLGLTVPNLWLIAAIKSPTINAVGFMVPGLPFVALGRNTDMAWGGTNLRAASSDLYEVSGVAPDSVRTSEARIGTRFWFDSDVELRRHALGPIVSDSPLINGRPDEVLALRWVGHEATDEITAFLAANRAQTPDEFRAAFERYGVSAQNMIFADTSGNIGHVLASTQPRRSYDVPPDIVLDGADPTYRWQGFDTAMTLPFVLNPSEGFVASGNNRPPQSERPLSYFYAPDDRVLRMAERVRDGAPLAVEDLMALQLDVLSPPAAALADALLKAVDGAQIGETPLLVRLRGWNGDYGRESSGAVAFELLLSQVARGLYGEGEDREVPGLRGQWPYLTRYLPRDLAAMADGARRDLLNVAIAEADRQARAFPTWGDMHRMRVSSLLANIPVVGGAFVEAEYPVAGSRQTIYKSNHELVDGRHYTTYGSQARHISDMADPDANYFVLMGGQDGWRGSANYVDQVPLWFEGQYVRVPLNEQSAAETFAHHMDLLPHPTQATR